MKKIRIISLLLAVLMILPFAAACSGSGEDGTSTDSGKSNIPANDDGTLNYLNVDGLTYGKDGDYISLYDLYGKEVTTDDVKQNDDGDYYIEKDGKQYVLGLDFLSMAMVYNCGDGTEAEQKQAYAKWWQYYIERWNKLLPEMPLYSNEYYDVYNTQIGSVKEHPTNPFWSPANALIEWTSSKSDNSIIIGATTELSGTFRYATFGASSPGSADLDVQNLTDDLSTIVTNKEGEYVWNTSVVKSHTATANDDGSKTYEIEICDDLKFSDGSAVTAKDFLSHVLAFSSPVATEAAGKNHRSGMNLVGFDDFSAYTGPGSTEGKKEFSGIRLLGDYKFSVTVSADYLPYFYDMAYASLSAEYAAMWLGDAEIKDDGNGVYLSDSFYDKDGDSYKMAAHIKATSKDTDTSKYPYSGPYVVESYDASTKTAVLKKNTYFKGNFEGVVPSIEKIVYKKVVSATQLEDLKTGGVDILMAITGGDATKEALALIDSSDGKFASVNYSRAGYGKLGYRCDFGPAQFTAVRQAIAYCVDREQFAKDFTGGYGTVSNGPYYTGSWMYQAVKGSIKLNAYATSKDTAIALLEADGWNYDKDGNAYVSGIRYKKIAASVIKEADKTYASKDGKYTTTKVGDFYYMPLVINWFGTTDNDFTDLLVNGFKENSNIGAIGMEVQSNFGDFYPMLAEMLQTDYGSGTYGGTPLYSAFNFATGFTSAVYDYSYNLTVDPSMYADYSAYYIKDVADIVYLK